MPNFNPNQAGQNKQPDQASKIDNQQRDKMRDQAKKAPTNQNPGQTENQVENGNPGGKKKQAF